MASVGVGFAAVEAMVWARLCGWALMFWVLAACTNKVGTPPTIVKPSERMYWTSSVVATLHAIVLTWGSATRLLAPGFQYWAAFEVQDPSWERYVEFSCGYFAYDLWMIAVNPDMPGRLEMLFHHIVSAVCHFYPCCVYHYGCNISIVAYVVEISNPFTNLRWMLMKAGGGTKTTVYLVNGIAMTLLFFVFRILWIPVSLYQVLISHKEATGVPLGAALGGTMLGHAVAPLTVVFYGLNIFWFYKMGKGAMKLIGGAGGEAAAEAESTAASPHSESAKGPVTRRRAKVKATTGTD